MIILQRTVKTCILFFTIFTVKISEKTEGIISIKTYNEKSFSSYGWWRLPWFKCRN